MIFTVDSHAVLYVFVFVDMSETFPRLFFFFGKLQLQHSYRWGQGSQNVKRRVRCGLLALALACSFHKCLHRLLCINRNKQITKEKRGRKDGMMCAVVTVATCCHRLTHAHTPPYLPHPHSLTPGTDWLISFLLLLLFCFSFPQNISFHLLKSTEVDAYLLVSINQN